MDSTIVSQSALASEKSVAVDPIPATVKRTWTHPVSWLLIVVMFSLYAVRLARTGIDLRWGFWEFWQTNRFYSDLDNPLYNGRFVLRKAVAIERDDQRKGVDSPGELTIYSTGPGLFDPPLSYSTFVRRWHQLRPVYGHIFHGWVSIYDQLQNNTPDGNYQMDYPPIRSLVMMLWAWNVDSKFANLTRVPEHPTNVVNRSNGKTISITATEVVHPLLVCNMVFEAISSVTMFLLVWLWVSRASRSDGQANRSRFGDPLLLLPVLLLGLFHLLQPYFRFDMNGLSIGTSVLDLRVASIGWWVQIVLKYTSVVALARFLPHPFKAFACATVALTVMWLNPATVLESFGWPQWEAWLIPFFLIPALLISVNAWLTAGLFLGVGCMFKGQLMFVAPMLLFCPLFVGWFGRFMRIIAGFGIGAGFVVWPWLINSSRSMVCVVAVFFAAVIVCGISLLRPWVWADLVVVFPVISHRLKRLISRNRRQSVAVGQSVAPAIESSQMPRKPTGLIPHIPWHLWIGLVTSLSMAFCLLLLMYRSQDPAFHHYTVFLTVAVLLLPWFIPRRHLSGWIACVFAGAIWLAGASMNGSFSWWQVGFVYGTQKHQNMELGAESLSNLPAILERRYEWNLHDQVGTWHLPGGIAPVNLDVRSGSAVLFGITLLICTIATGIHLRRRDSQFLVALVTPWILFVTLLTQMAARYTVFPAVMAASLVGVSVGMSLMQIFLICLSCAMLGNQMLSFDPATAPLVYAITRRTFPDMGWMMLLLAGIFLISTLMPSRSHRIHRKPK